MALPASIIDVLKRERIPFVTFNHPPAFSALEQAAVSHTPGRCSAKVVICIADGKPLQAVVPAHYLLDLEQLRLIVGAATLRLAHEDEIAVLYPEFEVGAMPPFGTMYGIRSTWSAVSRESRRWCSAQAPTLTASGCTTSTSPKS